MSDVKWIKLSTNMFEDEKIKLIEQMPEADTLLVVWIKLLSQAGRANNHGYIYLSENIPYTDEMLATIFNRPLNVVRMALGVFRNFGMIEIDDNHFISICNWDKHQNTVGLEKIREQNRLRKQKERERKKLELLPPSHVTVTQGHATEEEQELELEQELEEEREEEQQEDVGQSVRPSSDFAKLVDFTNNNIQPVAQAIGEKLGFILDEYKDVDLIIEALKESIMKPNVKNKYTYAEGILRNWKNELITNLEQLNAKRTREANQHGTNGSNHAKASGKGIDDVYRQLERDKQAWGD